MLPIYCNHFGLTREPFNITPDPNFLYMSASHREALAQLVYGIKARRGFVVLTGEVGTGKTTMIQCLLDELNASTKTALIFNMIVSPRDLMRYVCEKFALISNQEGPKDLHDYIYLLERFLLEIYRSGENVALIIDEAQNLSTEVLENLRLLSNFETAQDKLLQILLVGQPELGTRLNAPELRQIKQRVALRHNLTPLDLAECQNYIVRRLEIAGGNISLFGPDAIGAVHKYSGGIPRLMNIICDNALLTAYALRKEVVEEKMIAEVAKDLEITVSLRRPTTMKPLVDSKSSDSHGQKSSAAELGRVGSAFAEKSVMQDPKSLSTSNGVHAKSATSIVSPIAISNGVINFEQRAAAGPKSLPRSTPAESGVDRVPAWFFGYMVRQLAEAMGPMADFVLRDRISAIGETMDSFPKHRLAQLVEEASGEILSDSLKAGFKRAILNQIQTLNSTQ
jgi:type II secretory pathway predicted ATPase ExeA